MSQITLRRSGRKNELVERFQAGNNEKRISEKVVQNEEVMMKQTDESAGSVAGPSGEPKQKKLKMVAGNSNVSSPGSAVCRQACLDSCRPGKKHGCANRSYGKPRHGNTKSCHKVERILAVLGVNPKNASRCIKAAIMKGHIDIKGEEGELDMVVHEEMGQCGHMIQAKLGDLLQQPDYVGLFYEDGCENATVICTESECDEGRTYVTELCKGEGNFNDGKQHNHCTGCPGFGSCIGDYRERHCDSCGKHSFIGLMGPMGESRCDNRRCIVFKKWQANRLKKSLVRMGFPLPDEAIKSITGASPHPSEESDSDSDY